MSRAGDVLIEAFERGSDLKVVVHSVLVAAESIHVLAYVVQTNLFREMKKIRSSYKKAFKEKKKKPKAAKVGSPSSKLVTLLPTPSYRIVHKIKR